eukprot:gb/GECG01005455.1/.p1 GENE.gb/GECG01005455.1/~~gb/GECG01005455.1/.p1  ORF type:complete len:171 (+),score=7.65 gb/GECG01005455.1/:1-513(+)
MHVIQRNGGRQLCCTSLPRVSSVSPHTITLVVMYLTEFTTIGRVPHTCRPRCSGRTAMDQFERVRVLPGSTSYLAYPEEDEEPYRYLRTVDRFHDNQVTAYITPKTRIMIAHKGISEERIHELCKEVHELYLKVLQNPLYEPGTKIWCKNFDKRVRALIKKHLGVQINHT